MTPHQQRVYDTLETLGTATNQEMAQHLDINPASATSTLNKLLRQGLVSRKQIRRQRPRHEHGLEQVGMGYARPNAKLWSNYIDLWSIKDG